MLTTTALKLMNYPWKTLLSLSLMVAIFTGCESADGGQCLVTKVYDGDTVTLKCPGQADVTKVRMYCIDTPEMKQAPWGEAARDHLRGIIGKKVTVTEISKDRYGRVVGEVLRMAMPQFMIPIAKSQNISRWKNERSQQN